MPKTPEAVAYSIFSALAASAATYAVMSLNPQAMAVRQAIGAYQPYFDNAVANADQGDGLSSLAKKSVVSVPIPVPSSWIPAELRTIILQEQTAILQEQAEANEERLRRDLEMAARQDLRDRPSNFVMPSSP